MVSEISLGTVELGMDYGIRPEGDGARPDESTAGLLLNRALDLGINYVDTARLYGVSEEVIGRALRTRREKYVLASKVPLFPDEGLSGEALRLRVTGALHESLTALQTDVIDVMMLHSPRSIPGVPPEILDVLEGFRRQGAIRYVGASVYGEADAVEAVACGRYDCIQIAYSMLDRRPETRALPDALAQDVGIVVRSVLLKGVLTHRAELLPDALEPLRRAAGQLAALAAEAGLSLPEMAYRYVLAHPAAHTALVGTARLEELEAALAYAERGPLPDDLVARARAIGVDDESLLNPANWPT
jgi:aryl-alcohol dehydrogenase-like predicted oxidoreductase